MPDYGRTCPGRSVPNSRSRPTLNNGTRTRAWPFTSPPFRRGPSETLELSSASDYAQVYLNGELIGTLDRRLGQKSLVLPERKKPGTLEILVEAMAISISTSAWRATARDCTAP